MILCALASVDPLKLRLQLNFAHVPINCIIIELIVQEQVSYIFNSVRLIIINEMFFSTNKR